MKRGCLIWAIVLGGIALLVLIFGSFFTGRYNAMVRAEETVNESWAQVENVYQRRLDLIPNLVNTVKGVANFEQETYTAVAEARAKAGQVQIGADTINNPEAFQRFQEAQGELSGALSRLLVAVERYPELKANQNFLELQTQLEGTENRIAVERRRFNETAREFNALIRTFPNSIVATLAGFKSKSYFTATEGAERAPKVEF
jgi:LemA protein